MAGWSDRKLARLGCGPDQREKAAKVRTGMIFGRNDKRLLTSATLVRDLIAGLERTVPEKADYRHAEGNSPAHIKASLVGASETVFVENGDLVLGTWQGIFFCEFDGPRRRNFYVKVTGE